MTDLNLEKGSPLLTDDIDILKQEINILFDTRPGDLIGAIDYGTDYEKDLYQLNMSPNTLSDQMRSDLQQLELFDYNVSVDTKLAMGTERDIALIQVNLTKDDVEYTLNYNIS